ncbi:cell division protein ZapA [Aerococcaceae bacterium WGS1372]
MEEKLRFKATIAGKVYTIVGQKDPNHLQDVVDIVNNQLDQLSELAPELSYSDRSILMSVNAVSDQLSKEARIIELEKEIDKLKEELVKNQQTPFNKTPTPSTQSANSYDNMLTQSRRFDKVPFERRFKE